MLCINLPDLLTDEDLETIEIYLSALLPLGKKKKILAKNIGY